MLDVNSLAYSGVNEDNIELLTRTLAPIYEKRAIELFEYSEIAAREAYTLYLDGLGIYEIIGTMFEDVGFDSEPEFSALNRKSVEMYSRLTSGADRAQFALLFTEAVRRAGMSLSEGTYLAGGDGDGRCVYVKNRLADEAYDVFSQELFDTRVLYAKDFKEATRAVFDGRAQFCLLPLEERAGARIPSISAMLYKEDLKINSVTPVFGPDGSADMKYALVSRHFTVPEVAPGDDRYLEIRLPKESADELAELISAAGHFDTSVYRINTSVYASEDGEQTYLGIVFSGTGVDFTPLLTYLSIFSPSYTAVGIYSNIE